MPILLNAAGKRILTASGKVRMSTAGDPCCCVPACSYCTDVPRIVRITFAGTVSCGCSHGASAVDDVAFKHTAGTFDGTYDLERYTGAADQAWYVDDRGPGEPYGCAWIYRNAASPIEGKRYTNPPAAVTCDPSEAVETSTDLRIVLEANNSLLAYLHFGTYSVYLFNSGFIGETLPGVGGWCRETFPLAVPGGACGDSDNPGGSTDIREGGTSTLTLIL